MWGGQLLHGRKLRDAALHGKLHERNAVLRERVLQLWRAVLRGRGGGRSRMHPDEYARDLPDSLSGFRSYARSRVSSHWNS